MQERCDLDQSQMSVFNLTKTMRMSVDIQQMVQVFQKEIEKEPIIIPLMYQKPAFESLKDRLKAEATRIGEVELDTIHLIQSKEDCASLCKINVVCVYCCTDY